MLDLYSPSEFGQARLDSLPQSAVNTNFSHTEFYSAEEEHQGDWRQIADWISDQQEVPFSPIPYSPHP